MKRYLKVDYVLQKLTGELISKSELDEIGEAFFKLITEVGYTVSGKLSIHNDLKRFGLMSVHPKKEEKKDHFTVGETILDHTQKYGEYKKPIELRAMYNSNQLADDIDDKALTSTESRICKSAYKMLIIEDEEDIIGLYKILLKSLGFSNITYEKTGKEAIERIEKEDFHLVLSDYRLSDSINGYNIYNKFLTKKSDGVFVLISGYSEYEFEHLRKQKVLILPKPFSMTNLTKIILGLYNKYLENKINQPGDENE